EAHCGLRHTRRRMRSRPPPRPLRQRGGPPAGESSSLGRSEDVAHAAHRMHDPRLAAGLGLAAQVADVDLERVRGRTEVIAPNAVEDRPPGEYLAGMAEQQFEQQELRAGELDAALAAPCLMRRGVELEVFETQHPLIALPAGPPQQRSQPGDELLAG